MSEYNKGAQESGLLPSVEVKPEANAQLSEIQAELAKCKERQETLMSLLEEQLSNKSESALKNKVGSPCHSSAVMPCEEEEPCSSGTSRGRYKVLDELSSGDLAPSCKSEAPFVPVGDTTAHPRFHWESRLGPNYKSDPGFSTGANVPPGFWHKPEPPRHWNYNSAYEQMHLPSKPPDCSMPVPHYAYPSMAPPPPVMPLPQLQIRKFGGDIGLYPSFVQEFKAFIENSCHDNHRRLLYLQMYVTGEPARLIQNCNVYPNKAEGYYKAWELLNSRYGSSLRMRIKIKEELLKGPKIRSSDSEQLNHMAVQMNNCKCLFEAGGNLPELNGTEILSLLLARLPLRLQEKFAELAFHKQCAGEQATFVDILGLVTDAARYAEMEWAQQVFKAQASQANYPRSQPRETNRKDRVLVVSKDVGRDCSLCGGDHPIWKCNDFLAKALIQRRAFVRESGLCFNCLKGGHRASRCSFRKSCQTCHRKHNTLLHDGNEDNDKASVKSKSLVASTPGEVPAHSVLSIVPVKVWGGDREQSILTYALLDTGSTTSICTQRLVDKLKLKCMGGGVKLQGIGDTATCSSKVSLLHVQGMAEDEIFTIPSVMVLQRLPNLSENIPSERFAEEYAHLSDIHFPKLPSSDVDVLLGMDAHEVFRIREQRCGKAGEPLGWHTAIGWTILGAEFEAEVNADSGSTGITLTATRTPEGLKEEVLQFLEQDFKDVEEVQDKVMSRQDQRALSTMEGSINRVDGHYQMRLPWKEEKEFVPNNRSAAEQRLQSLKRRLAAKEEVRVLYAEKIGDYITNGYASQLVDPAPSDRTWYLPHHCTGPKFRVVFDCAAKYRGVSLNNMLLQGPDLCNNLTGVLLRFRQDAIAFVADIRGMFHQVRVDPSDRDVLRFLWWPDGDLSNAPAEYRMNVFPFGATCSPSCTAYALLQTAKDNATNACQEVRDTVSRSFYVDDLLKSCGSVDEAIKQIGELVPLLQSGGFHLTKFIANNQDVLSCVSDQDIASSGTDVTLHDETVEKALGVFWSTSADCLKVQVDVKEKPMTRRGLLSMVNQVYDVLGIVQPFVLPIRKLLQESCRDGSGWDDPIPVAANQLWQDWLQGLPNLRKVSVPRSFKLADKVCTSIELHVFSDASTVGYGVASYIRALYDDNTVSNVFCMGKSRVTPSKPVTVPRLELTAATTAVKLGTFICNMLDFDFHKVYFWTDATIVLQYIHNCVSRFRTFVANRLQIIHNYSTPEQWRYVPTSVNPADVASRGLMPSRVDTAGLWFNGPPFLREPLCNWPQQPEVVTVLPEEDEEMKKVCTVSAISSSDSLLKLLFARHSEYKKIQRSVAWLRRFKSFILWKHSGAPKPMVGFLSGREMHEATIDLVKLVQWEEFPDAMTRLHSTSVGEMLTDKELLHYPALKPLRKLDPILLGGVLRVGGRLRNADLPLETMHPIILPPDHSFTKMLIRRQHEDSGHSGTSHVLNSLFKTFWVIRGRAAVQKVLRSCFRCRTWNSRAGEQRMADLPEARTSAGDRPFYSTGVDLMGPLLVKQGRSTVKRYVVLFTCMATRAVHLEIAQSLEAGAFIQTFRRFICRRGKPRAMFSDNATNFKGAERELNDGVKAWKSAKFQHAMALSEIEWKYNVPACSHSGGVWERLIRSVRKHMRLVVGDASLDDFELSTVIIEIERILNDRPITDVSTDPKDLTALTPGMLLSGTLDPVLPDDVSTKRDLYRRSWRKTQALANKFWSRWLSDYLPMLQPRAKWFGTSPNLQVGDLVLIADDNVKRGCWPKAIVKECYADRDGLVRRVRVQTADNILMRDVRKICLLEGHLYDWPVTAAAPSNDCS